MEAAVDEKAPEPDVEGVLKTARKRGGKRKLNLDNMETISVYDRWLSLIHRRLKDKLLEGDIIHADESRVQVLKEPGRTPDQVSYVWVFCTPVCSDTPINLYQYHPSRAGRVVSGFLKDWTGYLTTDGYAPYFKLGANITNTACLVHLRRKYTDLAKSSGGVEALQGTRSVTMEAIRLINEIFSIDKKFDEMDPQERKLARITQLAPKLDSFEAWARARIAEAIPGDGATCSSELLSDLLALHQKRAPRWTPGTFQ